MLCHLGIVFGVIFPLGHFLFPLVIWKLQRPQDPEVAREAKVSLNFVISYTLWILLAVSAAISWLVFFARKVGQAQGSGISLYRSIFSPIAGFSLFTLLFTVGSILVLFSIVNARRAYQGRNTYYPCSIRFLK